MLGQRVYACSTLWNRAKLLSKVIMQFTASMSSEWKLSALSVLTNSWYFWTFWFFLIWWEWNGILYGLNLINMRLIFSYVYWSYIFFYLNRQFMTFVHFWLASLSFSYLFVVTLLITYYSNSSPLFFDVFCCRHVSNLWLRYYSLLIVSLVIWKIFNLK